MEKPVRKAPWIRRVLVRVAESLLAANERVLFGAPMSGSGTPQEPARDVTPEKKQIPGPGEEQKPGS